jgi:hypothetical protein
MNMNWSDELQALDQVGPSRDVWADALARSESSSRDRCTVDGRSVGLARMRSWPRRSAVAVSVALLAALGAGSALAYEYLGPSPGFTAGLSALNTLPPVAWPSSLPSGALADEAGAIGLTASQAGQRLRLLQSGRSLGNTNGINLYAFPGNGGTGCLFITGPDASGICLSPSMANNPALDGVAYANGGGDSMQTPGPLAVWGLVADNVSGVETDISGVTHTVPIVNNSFYADYDQITTADTIRLMVTFTDGTTKTFDLANPYTGG